MKMLIIKLQRYKDGKIKNLNNIFSFAKQIFKDIYWDLISIYNLNWRIAEFYAIKGLYYSFLWKKIYEYVIKNEKNVCSKYLFAVGNGFVFVCVTWVVTLWFVCEYIKLLVLFYFWWKRLISPSHASFTFLSKVNTFQFLVFYKLPWIDQTESMKSSELNKALKLLQSIIYLSIQSTIYLSSVSI